MGTITKGINVSIVGSTVTVDPSQAIIPDVGTGDTVTITWTPVGGCRIDEITWNAGSDNPPSNPAPDSNGGTHSVTYSAPTSPVNWNYTIFGRPAGIETRLDRHDPEIDNVHP